MAKILSIFMALSSVTESKQKQRPQSIPVEGERERGFNLAFLPFTINMNFVMYAVLFWHL